VNNKNSYLAIFKLKKKKNKHKLLVKAGKIGTKKLVQGIELKKYKMELDIKQKRKLLEKLKDTKKSTELKLLKKK
jgi:hypothetical protein